MNATAAKNYQAGYQAALSDIADALHEGGTGNALMWIVGNSTDANVQARVQEVLLKGDEA